MKPRQKGKCAASTTRIRSPSKGGALLDSDASRQTVLDLSNLSGQKVAGKKNNAPPTAMEKEPGGVPFPRGWNPRSLIELVTLKRLRQEAMLEGAAEVGVEGEGSTPSLCQPQPGLALTPALGGPSHPQITTLLQQCYGERSA